MGRLRTLLDDCEYFVVLSVLFFALSLFASAFMIGMDIIDEMNEFTEKIRSDLEEFQIIADDASETMQDFTLKVIEGVNETVINASYRKTFNR
ncbi:hypothetical protein PRIPAC_83500 [Pristionchus pacificus]|uniref:Uncharacterized protein n=1 Tax=Pristionchus pacificus TaxID=54126 RepID=A0A2A6BMG8_PRIPA|nr:hypothetical protein PRIPAC_83500 [Pristionchus pacificus]|eukprot:PDM67038.1 hypothetical protein PRIPAC_48455 [Pristionchus pacificus]